MQEQRQPENPATRVRKILVAKVFGWRSNLNTPSRACGRARDVCVYCSINRRQRFRLSRALASRESNSLPPFSSHPKKPFNTFLRCPNAIRWRVASAIAWRPSAVFGPVLMPPWFLHRPLASAFAWHGLPVLRANAPHFIFRLIESSFDAVLV